MGYVIVATDGSHSAQNAYRKALELELFKGRIVVVVSVVPSVKVGFISDLYSFERQAEHDAMKEYEKHARSAALEIRKTGVEVELEIRQGEPADEIVATVEKYDADFLVMGTKMARGLAGVVQGSVARRVLGKIKRPIFIFPRGISD